MSEKLERFKIILERFKIMKQNLSQYHPQDDCPYGAPYGGYTVRDTRKRINEMIKTLKNKTSMNAILYYAEGGHTHVMPTKGNEFTLDQLQKFIGGYIEIIRLPKLRKTMVIDEEGKLKDLPVNLHATNLFRANYPGIQDYIVGPALICDENMIK